MSIKNAPLAICYDFDGTLSPGYMQDYEFIPKIGMTSDDFWNDVTRLAEEQHGDGILIYMGLLLRKADAAGVSVKEKNLEKFGEKIKLFKGVQDWFDRINAYGRDKEIEVEHYIISSGLRELIRGTPIGKYFKEIFASGYWYDHEGVARFPAIGVNYTTKTQYLFRINKGSLNVWDREKINRYIPDDERPIPFSNIVFFGDGDTDIPCFRLVKDQGGHAVAVYEKTKNDGGKTRAFELIDQGRVNFAVPANYSQGSEADILIKAIIEKLSADHNLAQRGNAS